MDVAEKIISQATQDQRIQCPKCAHQRKKSKEKTLSITVHPDRSLYDCHHCGYQGVIHHEEPLKKYREMTRKKVRPLPTKLKHDTDTTAQFFAGRGIKIEGQVMPRMTTAEKYFPALQEKTTAIGFVYGPKEQPEAIKWRPADGRKTFTQDGAASEFYGLERIEGTPEEIVIVEGEADVVALASIGITALSCPNGAPSKVSKSGGISPEDDKKFSYVWEARDLLGKAEKVIIAVDQDEPGAALAEELARRIGRAKCYRAKFPDGLKDPTDVIREAGEEAMRHALDESEAFPLAGVYTPNQYASELMEVYREGLPPGESTGYESVDKLFTIKEGQLYIVTGLPSSGKSEFIDQIMVNLAVSEGWNWGIASFENPPAMHMSKLAEKLVRKPFGEGPNTRMSRDELEGAVEFMQEHFAFLESRDGAMPTVQSILDRAKQAVMRLGIRGLIIDPFNYINIGKEESQNDAISRMLSEINQFAKAFGVAVFFVAHPQKIYPKENGRMPVPKGMHISGCYSDDTEVLTERGWIPHPEVTKADKVMCFNPETEALSYNHPEHVHCYEHEGVMHHWSSGNLDMLVTPNHRMVVKPAYRNKPKKGSKITGRPPTWKMDEWQFCPSEGITGTRWSVPMTGRYSHNKGASTPASLDGGHPSIDLHWYIGFWIAEGCMQSGGVSVCQADENSALPREVIKRLGICETSSVTNYKQEEKPMWTSRMLAKKHPQLSHWIPDNCGEGSENKRLPDSIWSASRDEKMAMLEGLEFGDGNVSGSSVRLTTTSQELAGQYQRLCIELGYWAWVTYSPSDNPKWKDRWTVTRRKANSRTIERRRNLAEVPYSGKVYCLTVPGGAYVTRRNGRMAICGNSAAWFAKADFGITVHRDEGPVEVHCWKVRHKWLGSTGKTIVGYDMVTGRYKEIQSAPQDHSQRRGRQKPQADPYGDWDL